MSGQASIGLSAGDVSTVFPFHVGFDADHRIVQLGPSLSKIAPGIALGHLLSEHFRIEAPAGVDPRALATLSQVLVVLRSCETGALLRGQIIAQSPASRWLFLCSPWLTSTNELNKLGLQLTDFALHDPMADLLQVMQAQDATLVDVRKLVSKLADQRKEQRVASSRMASLYEVTRILAAGTCVEDVAVGVLERFAEAVRLPVATMWLLDSTQQFVHRTPGPYADSASKELERLLAELPPDWAADIWQATACPLVRRLAPGACGGGRAADAVALGFPVAYQLQIEGVGGLLGAFEIYGPAVPSNERALLDTMNELAMRMGQFIDKTRADAALRASIKAAAAAAAAKSQFLARMSHEIRTPINGVLGMIELVLTSTLTSEQRTQLETARSSGELLLGLVNDVLDFSKIEAGYLEINAVPFELHACLRRAYDMFAPRAAAKHLALHLRIDPQVPCVAVGDELRFSQVLVNLLGNAMKFTRSGSIDISVRSLPRTTDELYLEVAVRDTGIGIPEARREAIFAAFTQAELSTAREFGGTGLGLAICKQLVELMGGEFKVASVVGEGSVFTFTVCMARAEEGPVESPEARGAAAEEAVSSLHILVVEDNEINQAVVRGLLERDGHIVEIADRMESAITRGCEGTFDVILMDVQLPDGDGLTATTAIRAHARRAGRANVPIIGLSAQAVAGDRERALSVGMDEYLTKPIRPMQLRAALAQLPVRPVRARRAPSTVIRAYSDRPVVEPCLKMEPWSREDQDAFLSRVKEYADLSGMIFSLSQTLAADARGRLQELEACAASGTLDRVKFIAHGLVGSAGTVGFVSIERAARAIEELVRAQASASSVSDSLVEHIGALRAGVKGLEAFVASSVFDAARRENLDLPTAAPTAAGQG